MPDSSAGVAMLVLCFVFWFGKGGRREEGGKGEKRRGRWGLTGVTTRMAYFCAVRVEIAFGASGDDEGIFFVWFLVVVVVVVVVGGHYCDDRDGLVDG